MLRSSRQQPATTGPAAADWPGVSRVVADRGATTGRATDRGATTGRAMDRGATTGRAADLRGEPRSRERHPTVRRRDDGAWLSDRDADAVPAERVARRHRGDPWAGGGRPQRVRGLLPLGPGDPGSKRLWRRCHGFGSTRGSDQRSARSHRSREMVRNLQRFCSTCGEEASRGLVSPLPDLDPLSSRARTSATSRELRSPVVSRPVAFQRAQPVPATIWTLLGSDSHVICASAGVAHGRWLWTGARDPTQRGAWCPAVCGVLGL